MGARKLYETFQEIDREADKFEIRLDKIEARIYDVIRVAYGLSAIFLRMGLPENIEDSIRIIYRAIAAANMLRASLIAVTAASGPWGTAAALISVAGSAMALQMEIASPRYV